MSGRKSIINEEKEDFTGELQQFPEPGIEGVRLLKIEKVCLPHPYMIGAKHVEHTSDHHSGILGEYAIEDGEKHDIYCEICKKVNRKDNRKILKYSEHTQEKALFIEVPSRDLNDIKGLHEYMLSIKPLADQLKITGFAFPMKKDRSD